MEMTGFLYALMSIEQAKLDSIKSLRVSNISDLATRALELQGEAAIAKIRAILNSENN